MAGMSSSRFKVPSSSSLIAFEATARLGGVIRASEELNTSQSAISRHIHNLEAVLGQKLFQRQGRGVVLTSNGQDYYVAVKSALERLHGAGHGLRTQTRTVTIACTQEISHFLLLPIFSEIKHSMEESASVRVLNCDYDVLHLLLPAGVDIIFEYSAAPPTRARRNYSTKRSFRSPRPPSWSVSSECLQTTPTMVRCPPVGRCATRPNLGHMGHLVRAHDCDAPNAPVEPFENYEYLLEAAARGEGMALGWNGFVNRYLESGQLVKVRADWLRLPIALYAVLTQAGHSNRNAISCLKQLAALERDCAAQDRYPRSDSPLADKSPIFEPS